LAILYFWKVSDLFLNRLQALYEKDKMLIETLSHANSEHEQLIARLTSQLDEVDGQKQQWEAEKEEFAKCEYTFFEVCLVSHRRYIIQSSRCTYRRTRQLENERGELVFAAV
jgi:DNA repair exonuclease SbcCD ATPase subunit